MRHYREWGGGLSFASMANDAYTKLLIHSDSTDTSQVFTDSSTTGHVVNAVSDIEHTTDVPAKFLKTSIHGFNLGGYLTVADHAEFVLGADPFTIDFWTRFSADDDVEYFYHSSDADNYILLDYQPSLNSIRLRRRYTAGGAFFDPDRNWTFNPALNQWYHIALIRGWGGNVNSWMVTIDGKAAGVSTTSSITVPDYTNAVEIFEVDDDTYCTEFRLSVGVARWIGPFVPPIGPYT